MEKYLTIELTESESLALVFAIASVTTEVFKGTRYPVIYSKLSEKIEESLMKL